MVTREDISIQVIDIVPLTITRETSLGDGEETATQPEAEEQEDEVFMPDELLVTFVDTTARPLPEDRRVQALLSRLRDLAGLDIEVLPRRVAADDEQHPHLAGAPLTLRCRIGLSKTAEGERHQLKETADRINAALEHLQHEGILVSSAAPNWIVGSSGGRGSPMGGPGTLPDPAPAGTWPIQVPAGGQWTAADISPDKKVIVAVLDSSPGRQALVAAAGRPQFQANALMQSLAADGVVVDWNRFSPPSGVPSRRAAVEADHGIFVSGIVHRIAPHAEIHLLHVLDDAGMGHTQLLLDALDYCLALAHAGHRLIVNLSLYLTIPPGDHLWDHWFGPQGPRSDLHPGRHAALLEALDEAVLQRMAMLLDAGVVIVAAAGNDALRQRRASAPSSSHPRPRLPADYDGVICVVAANREGKIAAYSNRADVPATGNCVATYGGDGVMDGDKAVVPGSAPRDGLVSLYTDSEVHGEIMQPNTTGWVYWSGTSFATPVISGLAANVLARNEVARQANPLLPALTPRQVLTAILDLAAPAPGIDPALGCPFVPVSQVQ